jgi:hypothetical protein
MTLATGRPGLWIVRDPRERRLPLGRRVLSKISEWMNKHFRFPSRPNGFWIAIHKFYDSFWCSVWKRQQKEPRQMKWFLRILDGHSESVCDEPPDVFRNSVVIIPEEHNIQASKRLDFSKAHTAAAVHFRICPILRHVRGNRPQSLKFTISIG